MSKSKLLIWYGSAKHSEPVLILPIQNLLHVPTAINAGIRNDYAVQNECYDNVGKILTVSSNWVNLAMLLSFLAALRS